MCNSNIFNNINSTNLNTNSLLFAYSKGLIQAYDFSLFYTKYFCKIGREFPVLQSLTNRTKPWVQKLNYFSKTTKLVQSFYEYKELKSKKPFDFFTKTLSFYVSSVKVMALKVPAKFHSKVSQIHYALNAFSPFADFYFHVKDQGLQNKKSLLEIYKMARSSLSLYLGYTMTRLEKKYRLALAVSDFALSHF